MFQPLDFSSLWDGFTFNMPASSLKTEKKKDNTDEKDIPKKDSNPPSDYKNKDIPNVESVISKLNDEIKNVIMMKNSKIDVAKKYLIIDDIFTSGSTIHRLIHLLLLTGIKKENFAVIIVAKSS